MWIQKWFDPIVHLVQALPHFVGLNRSNHGTYCVAYLFYGNFWLDLWTKIFPFLLSAREAIKLIGFYAVSICMYNNSLLNADSFYVNFTNANFQKIPISHLPHPMKQKFLHKCEFPSVWINWFHLTCLTRLLVNTTLTFYQNQK